MYSLTKGSLYHFLLVGKEITSKPLNSTLFLEINHTETLSQIFTKKKTISIFCEAMLLLVKSRFNYWFGHIIE